MKTRRLRLPVVGLAGLALRLLRLRRWRGLDRLGFVSLRVHIVRSNRRRGRAVLGLAVGVSIYKLLRMNDDGARKSFDLYAVRVWRGAGDLIICGLAAVAAKHSGGALAAVNGNPCGFVLKKE